MTKAKIAFIGNSFLECMGGFFPPRIAVLEK